MTQGLSISRRALVGGGLALLIGASLKGATEAQEAVTPPPVRPGLPGGLKHTPLVDAWIQIGSDGGVTVLTGKAELGQGIKTALIQVAAEELSLAPAGLRLVTADTGLTPNEGYTAGSHSMQDSATAIRHAAAGARAILVAAAARRWGIAPEGLGLDNGAVMAPDGRRLPFADLIAEADLHVEATENTPVRNSKDHTVVGRALPRIDIPGKVAGGAA
ncbi:molybdopterin cofactor-binding domain-containing protein [Methylobacterium sp. Leaf112]|uniref:molybdopterin cofactor-binding domain-containing protein n=1 Tax=Methylobacterium sp. Leaf112 TaxID=1736258 RepID=UPI000AAC7645